MIKWSSLQLNLMPVIAMETDAAIQKLQQLVEKVSTYGYPEDIQQLNAVRKSILNRIQSLDRFYEHKYHDETVEIFHMLKLKLQRAVFKIKHINNDTITSDTIANMFSNDSRKFHPQDIKESRNSKSPKKNIREQIDTFNHSIRDHFNEESRHHDLFYMQTGNSSFDFGFQNDQPLFKKSREKIKSPSSPSLKKNSLKKNKEKFVGLSKPTSVQYLHSSNNKLTLAKETSKDQIKSTKAPAYKKQELSKIEKVFEQKPKPVAAKNTLKNPKTEYKVIKPLPKQKRPYEKSKPYLTQYENKGVQRMKTDGNQRLNISSKHPTSTNLKAKNTKNKQFIKEQLIEQNELNPIDENQFRFTIKMTKQEYLGLQALRHELVKSGQLPE